MDRQGGFLIGKIKQLGGRVFDRILAEKDIEAFNGPQGRILYVLWQGDGISVSEISKGTGLAVTTLTSMLDRMEATDLIRRERDPKDRRVVRIFLTEEARGLEREYDEVSQEIDGIYYRGFTDREAEEFEAYLRRILANLEDAE